MSYDLKVYTRERVDRAACVDLINAIGTAVDERASSGDSLAVVRGARRRYSFTLELAKAVEPEDVPDEVTSAVLGPQYLYEILIEGSSAMEVPHAVRFAHRLAQAASGAVVDEQEGTVWSRGKLRTPPKVELGLIDVVEVNWWLTDRIDPVAASVTWLDLARRHFPEALPRRWGVFEPLSERVDPEDPEAFVKYVGRRDGTVHFKASAPAIDGSISDFSWGRGVGPVSITIQRSALELEVWREPLRRLFVEFASHTNAVVATAEVARSIGWSGRSLWFGPEAEDCPYRGTVYGWNGLPPYPVWWIWFGPDYAPLVQDYLDPAQVEIAHNGIFHSRSTGPADRDTLIDQISGTRPSESPFGRAPRRHVRSIPTAPWLPEELLAVPEKYHPERNAMPHLKPARLIPLALRQADDQ